MTYAARKPSSRLINSIARNAFPGDHVRIMIGAHKDQHGRWWPNKTEYTPLSSGADNTSDGAVTIQVVIIAGETVKFHGGSSDRHPLEGEG